MLDFSANIIKVERTKPRALRFWALAGVEAPKLVDQLGGVNQSVKKYITKPFCNAKPFNPQNASDMASRGHKSALNNPHRAGS